MFLKRVIFDERYFTYILQLKIIYYYFCKSHGKINMQPKLCTRIIDKEQKKY